MQNYDAKVVSFQTKYAQINNIISILNFLVEEETDF
jgi:hypothetical protein